MRLYLSLSLMRTHTYSLTLAVASYSASTRARQCGIQFARGSSTRARAPAHMYAYLASHMHGRTSRTCLQLGRPVAIVAIEAGLAMDRLCNC